MYQDLKRLTAYATSSANFLTNLVMKNQIDSYGWEVSEALFYPDYI